MLLLSCSFLFPHLNIPYQFHTIFTVVISLRYRTLPNIIIHNCFKKIIKWGIQEMVYLIKYLSIKHEHTENSGIYLYPRSRGMGQGSDRNKQLPWVYCLDILATLGVTSLVSLPVSLEGSNRGRHSDTHYQPPHICACTTIPCMCLSYTYLHKGKFKICVHICICMYLYNIYIFIKEKVRKFES